MNRCLSEETLLLLYEGDGSRDDQVHLAKCQICTLRYERLGKDIELIGQVFRESPPRTAVVRGHRSPERRWIPFAFAGAAAAILLWLPGQLPEVLQLPQLITSTVPQKTGQEITDEELASFFTTTIAPAIFSTTDVGLKELSKQATNLAYLQAAIDGGWPNDRCEADRTQKCDRDAFALLFEQEDG